MERRIVAVFTGNRAEYGLQHPILSAIAAHPNLEYRLIVSGAHLDSDFGRTLSEIESDGFTIHAEVSIDLDEDSLFATAKAIGTGVVSISQALDRIRPDVLVVYADRYEGFAAVIAGTQMGIPTAHVEGGDITEGGALDDSVRHAMTKLAHLHFTTNKQATSRILAMGEEDWRVKTVGFPAIDLIREGNLASEDELVAAFDIDLDRPLAVFTQHSVTTEFDKAAQQIKPALTAIKKLAAEGVQVVITYPNSDAGGRRVIREIEAMKTLALDGVHIYMSLGRYNYHGLLSLARNPMRKIVCVGNSSSGIKETPAFGCPAVNIGSRQDGRLRADNVIDVGYDTDEIMGAVHRAFDDMVFRNRCRTCDNPYGDGDAGVKIADALARLTIDDTVLRKRMTLKDEFLISTR